jgi:leader peptidase (prepilin peptidase) / N-methyltransferase
MGFPLAEVVWVTCVFLLGICAGSFLNVLVGRLPLEKSILWPNSRCLTCLHRLRLTDNLPVVGWLLRGGRCRFCGTRFSIRYMWVELATGIGFALIFYLEVLNNWHRIPFFDQNAVLKFAGASTWQGWVFFLHHAILFFLLLAAALCDWDHRAIPLSLTTTGTVIGLIGATLFPWPWPNDPAIAAPWNAPVTVNGIVVRERNWAFDGPADPHNPDVILPPEPLPRGLYPWPVWGPAPDGLMRHRWALGLLTGLAGAAAGMILIRSVKYMFEKGLGKEALGLGDADLMMMAGAFVGWQVVVVSFFIGALIALPFGIFAALFKGERQLPFGPGLAVGVAVTVMWWPWLSQALQPFLFEHVLLMVAILVMGGGLFVASIALRAFGFGAPTEPGPAVATSS